MILVLLFFSEVTYTILDKNQQDEMKKDNKYCRFRKFGLSNQKLGIVFMFLKWDN